MSSAGSSAVNAQVANIIVQSHPSTQTIPVAANPVMALNLPSNLPTMPGVPLSLQVPGISNVPIAVCAVNSPQTGISVSQPSSAAMQPVQANAGGGIIVLNVGGGNNNLATAISQLVAGGLVQQPQLVSTTTATVSKPEETVAKTMTAPQGHQLANQVLNTGSLSLAGNPIQTMPAGISAVVSNSPQPLQHVAPLQTNMAVGNQVQLSIPAQQAQQQTHAAFMLVPIPHVQTLQAQVNANSNYMNVNQQPKHQVLLNLQDQVLGSNSPLTLPNTMHQQQAMSHNMHQSQISSVSTTNLSQSTVLPKNDELKAFLTKSVQASSGAITMTQSSTSMPAAFPLSQFRFTSPHSSPGTRMHGALTELPAINQQSQISHHGLSAVSPQQQSQLLQQIQEATVPVPTSQFQAAISSPGLAFLAQVSSLSSEQAVAATSRTEPSPTVMTTNIQPSLSSSQFVASAENLPKSNLVATKEVNNNIERSLAGSLNEQDISLDVSLTRPCSTPSSSMTVSSTTKLGDDSMSEAAEEKDSAHSADILIQKMQEGSENNNYAFPANVAATSSPSDRKGVKEKRKKGPAPKLNGTETCLICGDKASGFHYNILSCEGCKGFFRRSVIKGANYQCKMNGDCQMDLFMRRKCQKCRFQKCKLVGMKEESVLSEEQVKAKKMKRESDTSFSPMRSICEDAPLPTLTPQQRNLVKLLKANERRFQWPTTEDMKKVTAWVEEDDSIHSRALRFAHFTELCILIVQLVVEFTKQLPGFLTVLREDQIVLLKACAIEVMLLRAAKQYNKHDGTINFLNGKLYDKSSFYRAGMQVEFVDPIFHFCNSMARLDLDETEYAILVAINTFSTDRPHIKDIEKVECMQDPYVELLRVYSRIRHPNDPLMFARILMKIVELRTLNNYHSEQIFALKVQDRKLPPLLAEIWDM